MSYPSFAMTPAGPTAPKIFLPTTPKDSMRFFQVPARKWWWGLIALAVYVAAYFLVQTLGGFVMVAVDPSMLQSASNGTIETTPSLFLINNLAIALDIGVCTLIAFVFFRQGFGWLVSVVGRFRWKWLGIALGVFALGYAIEMIVEIMIYGPDGYGLTSLESQPYTWFMLVSILLTTPFQCAGEEFQSRALLPRLINSIVPVRWLGLVLSALIPSLVFTYLHDAQDPWLNLNYFCVALMMWWLAWRTGGIEASIALHLVNNLFSEWTLPFTDISGMFDRSDGTGSPIVLLYLGVQLILVLIVDWIARRRGMVRLSAPGASTPVVIKPRQWLTRLQAAAVEATKADLPRIDTTVRETVAAFAGGYDPANVGYATGHGYGTVPTAYAMVPTAYGQLPTAYGQIPGPYGPLPVPYGQVPPGAYGQVPTTYGQVLPGAYGQVPGAYGQVPGAYAQVPATFGQVPGAYGQVPGAFGQVPPGAYGQAPVFGQLPPGVFGQVPGASGQLSGVYGPVPGVYGPGPGGYGQVPGMYGQVPGAYGQVPGAYAPMTGPYGQVPGGYVVQGGYGPTPGGSALVPGAYPSVPGAYPSVSEAYPSVSEAYPSVSEAYPPPPGTPLLETDGPVAAVAESPTGHSSVPGSYGPISGEYLPHPGVYGPVTGAASSVPGAYAFDSTSGASPQSAGGSAQLPGGSAQLPGGSAQLPGGSPQSAGTSYQIPGISPQTPGAYPQVPTTVGTVPGSPGPAPTARDDHSSISTASTTGTATPPTWPAPQGDPVRPEEHTLLADELSGPHHSWDGGTAPSPDLAQPPSPQAGAPIIVSASMDAVPLTPPPASEAPQEAGNQPSSTPSVDPGAGE